MRLGYYLPQGMDAFYGAIVFALVFSAIAWSFEMYMAKKEKEKENEKK